MRQLHLSARRKIALGAGGLLAAIAVAVFSIHHFVAFDRSVEVTLAARPGAASIDLRGNVAGA